MIGKFFDIKPDMLALDKEVMEICKPYFEKVDEVASYNQMKVLKAFIDNGISATHLVGTTGYGYDDRGRDGLDRLFADIMGAEDALCRYNFMSGTHTLAVALFGVLRTGDTIFCATGTPYDTLHGVIGIDGSHYGNLMDYGVKYDQCDLLPGSEPDLETIREKCRTAKVCYIQRSRGYAKRKALSLETIKAISDAILITDKTLMTRYATNDTILLSDLNTIIKNCEETINNQKTMLSEDFPWVNESMGSQTDYELEKDIAKTLTYNFICSDASTIALNSNESLGNTLFINTYFILITFFTYFSIFFRD